MTISSSGAAVVVSGAGVVVTGAAKPLNAFDGCAMGGGGASCAVGAAGSLTTPAGLAEVPAKPLYGE